MDIEFIREWFERAEQCNDDIDKFICYYILNAQYLSTKRAKQQFTERKGR